MLLHHQRAWEIALKKHNSGIIHSHTPLWHNNHLHEMESIPDSTVWASHGIIYLHQVVSNARLKPFHTFKEEYTLPNSLTFKYLQLRHAIRTQLPSLEVVADSPPVLSVIMGEDPTKLRSNLYYALRKQRSTTIAQKAKIKWEQDKGQIEDEDWDEILGGIKTASPKPSDRLTQLYIIHKAYLTPMKKSKFIRTYDPTCHLCHAAPGTFYHLIWSCPIVQTYWM